ncbi:MAG: hypothetical protein C0602_12930 [Denitrovibrio sp.]|nr:MAG: hypothetical protein C0602_12930 [Denitrovibrio sp.]
MQKEVNTFHSGKYLFTDEISSDLSVINEAINVFCRMPLFPETVSELKTNCIEKAVTNEARLEGSTITIDQVKNIILHERSNFSQDTMAIEVINICSAYSLIDSKTNSNLSAELISDIHQELTSSLPHQKDKEGSYRKGGVKADEKWLTVEYVPPGSPLDINFLVKHLIDWLEKDLIAQNPLVKAFLLHLHLKKIQPYYDANGHTARIIEAWYLKKHDFKILPYLLPIIYNVNITEYYRAVSEFYATSNITAFIQFISEALRITVEDIRNKNFAKYSAVISDGYLSNLLSEKILIKRQFDLLSLLKEKNITFTQEDLQLKKPFTSLYGNVSRTTVARDIKKFEDLGLIKASENGYKFNNNPV